jgi:hypothetical protein
MKLQIPLLEIEMGRERGIPSNKVLDNIHYAYASKIGVSNE